MIKNPKVRAQFQLMGLQANDAWELFRCLDVNKQFHIEYQQFVDGCLRLKDNATRLDIQSVLAETHAMKLDLSHALVVIGKQLEEIRISDTARHSEYVKAKNAMSFPSTITSR